MRNLYSSGFEFSDVFVVPANAGIQTKPENSTLTGIIVLTLFIMSFSLFAQESASQGQTESHENASPVSETQVSTPKETTNTNPPPDDPLFASLLVEIQKGRWTENRPPGPVFNTCSTWDGAVKCYWAVFRMENTTGQYREMTYAIHNHLTAEGLEQEFNYLKSSPDSLNPYSKAWFLLMTVEFFIWTARERLTNIEIAKILPIAHTFASELFRFVGIHLKNPQKKGMERASFVFFLYALYNFVSVVNAATSGGFAQSLQTLRESIKTHFFHRNDGSQADQSIKTKVCSFMKRTGIHRDYLEEKGLLLPGYEEFEEQTVREDKKRIEGCETEYKNHHLFRGRPRRT